VAHNDWRPVRLLYVDVSRYEWTGNLLRGDRLEVEEGPIIIAIVPVQMAHHDLLCLRLWIIGHQCDQSVL